MSPAWAVPGVFPVEEPELELDVPDDELLEEELDDPELEPLELDDEDEELEVVLPPLLLLDEPPDELLLLLDPEVPEPLAETETSVGW
jgi:hypothetical protein